jgi:hypothetical protein
MPALEPLNRAYLHDGSQIGAEIHTWEMTYQALDRHFRGIETSELGYIDN